MDGLDRLRQRTGEENEDLLYDLLESAEAVILSRRYPFREYPDDFLDNNSTNLQQFLLVA